MPQNQPAPDPEKLREFEQRMHYEGVAAFAAGPSPWENWDDAGTLGTWQRLDDSPRRPARHVPARSAGQRVLGAVTRLLVLMLLVGIGGVFFSSATRPPQLVSSAIQPPPIVARQVPAPPDTTESDTVAAELDTLPAPAAGPAPMPVLTAGTEPGMTAPDVPPGNTSRAHPAPAMSGSAGNISTSRAETDSPTSAQPVANGSDYTSVDSGPDTTPAAYEPQLQATQVADPAINESVASEPPAVSATDSSVAMNSPASTDPSDPLPASVPPPQPEPLTASTRAREQPATEGEHPAPLQTALQQPSAAIAAQSPAAAAQSLPPQATGTPDKGDWFVNLAAYNSENLARQVQNEFRSKGVETELVTITVNNRPMVRIRAGGYRSANEARDWVALLEERLGLSGVWISKR